jgi:putative Holliday junction resolvase
MKIIGLDLGTNSLGIAITDSLMIAAHGYENFTFEHGNFKKAREHLLEVLKKENVNEVVIGLPLHMSGEESERCQSTRRFVDDLLKENPNIIVHFEDERMTTIIAAKRLHEANISHKKQRDVIDKMAAVVILENYIETRGN